MSRYSTELYHHGIKGQKWGVRNGPPYPLERSSSKSRTESKAKSALKSYSSIDKKYGSRINDAISKGKYDKASELDRKMSEEMEAKVFKKLYDLGYDYVYQGGGQIDGKPLLTLQFGKYLDEPEITELGEKYANEFMISTEDWVLEDVSEYW